MKNFHIHRLGEQLTTTKSSYNPVYLSHMKALTRIKDPIHDTLTLTFFDREIVDSPYFQRLHFVLQNSTTYSAYPSNKNSRFIHSLGVANVAGRLFHSAINSSDTDTVQKFFGDFVSFLDTYFIFPATRTTGKKNSYHNKILSGWKQTISNRSKFSHCPNVHGLVKKSNKIVECSDDMGKGIPAAFVADTIWQALGICALAHDIGHLPMSHSFETALEKCGDLFELLEGSVKGCDSEALKKQFSKATQYRSGVVSLDTYKDHIAGIIKKSDDDDTDKQIEDFLRSLPVHERRSLYILSKIQNDNRYSLSEDDPVHYYRNLLYWVAFFILFSSIVDKAQKSGSTIGISNFKFTGKLAFLRVLKSFLAGEVDADRMDYTIRDGHACGSPIGTFDIQRVIDNSILIKKESEYFLSFYDRALSGIEQFFGQRRDSYKYLIYHRTSSRTEACLQELIARVIHYSFIFPKSKVAQLLEEHSFIKLDEHSNFVEGLLPLDEFALKSQDDSSLRSMLFQVQKQIRMYKSGQEEALGILCKPICCLCDIVLIREYKDIYSPFKHKELQDLLQESFPTEIDGKKIKQATKMLLQGSTKHEYAIKIKTDFAQEYPDVTTVINFQLPKGFSNEGGSAEDILLMDHEATTQNIEQRSSSLRNLKVEISENLKVNIYFIAEDLKNNTNKIKELNEFLMCRLRHYYLEILKSGEKVTKGKEK